MLTQLIQNFVHFKGRNDCLDQHGRLDAALGNTHCGLRRHEHLVPKSRLEMALELWQVEVRPEPTSKKLFGVVEHVQRKIKQAAGDALTIDGHMLLVQMPAARTHNERRHFFVQVIRLAVLFERNRATNRINQVDLPFDLIRPLRRIRILKVGHVTVGTRVQRVDHHLAIGGPGNLDATALECSRNRRNLPVPFANRSGLRQEIRTLAGIQALCPLDPRREQLATPRFELPVKARNQRERFGAQNLDKFRLDFAGNHHSSGQM